MNLTDNKKYLQDIQTVCNMRLPWQKLAGRTMVVSGATGMIGRCLVDVIMHKDLKDGLNCKVYVLGRSVEKAKSCFQSYYESENLWRKP